MSENWPEDARRRLLDLRRGPGAWGYRPRSTPAAEPSSLAALALLASEGQGQPDEGRFAALASARRLASIRRPDGSLGVTLDLPEPGWPTPFGLLLWSGLGGFELERSDAVAWLLGLEGRTTARLKDDPLGHDASIVGWPWVAETHSWVEPSAMALLALAREGIIDRPRVREGVRLLIDRAIPTGGWNVGNPVVFNTPLRPFPGPTGLALLALARLGAPSKVIDPACAYLRSALAGTLAPISLAWGLLGLRAWDIEPRESSSWLASSFEKVATKELRPVELAMLLLAVGDRSLELLGVVGQAKDPAPRDLSSAATGQSSSPLPEGGRGRGSLRSRSREAIRHA